MMKRKTALKLPFFSVAAYAMIGALNASPVRTAAGMLRR